MAKKKTKGKASSEKTPQRRRKPLKPVQKVIVLSIIALLALAMAVAIIYFMDSVAEEEKAEFTVQPPEKPAGTEEMNGPEKQVQEMEIPSGQ